MSTVRLIFKEIFYRRVNFALSVFGVIVAVALFVFYQTAGEGSQRETARTMRDLGLNLRIIPAEADMTRFYTQGFSDLTMPESYVDAMVRASGLSYAHLLPRLQQRATWHDREVFVVGLLPESAPVGRAKPTMSFEPALGEVYVGSNLADESGVQKGDSIELLGKTLRVERVLKEQGTQQDVSLFGHLHDIQSMFNLQDRINEIQAIDCLCFDKDLDTVEALRVQLKKVLPEAKVIRIQDMAEARKKQRYLIADYMAMIMPISLVLCAAWVGLLAMLNVRERRQEIGVMRALGYRSPRIAKLFLGKAILVGVIGAAIGFALGTWLALDFGDDVFKATRKGLKPMYDLLGWTLVIAPLFAAMATLIPTLTAVTHDPAVTLREE